MNYNPYTSQIRELETRISIVEEVIDSRSEQLDWYRSFDANATAERIIEEIALERNYAGQNKESDAQIQKATVRITELKQESRVSWRRKNWPFTTEWTKSKTQLNKQLKELEILEKKSKLSITNLARSRERITSANQSLHRYASFDIAWTVTEILDLEEELKAIREELISLRGHEKAVDLRIKDPLEEMRKVEGEIQGLERQLSEAQSMDREISRAANGYERKLVHEESQRKFNDDSPSRAASRLKRQLAPKRRAAQKLKNRIEDIIQRESQDVRSLIIDGSNLCYEGNKIIGLSTLRELCENIPEEIGVTVIFDGSILKKLGLPSEKALHTHMPDTAIHLIYDRTGADETILEAAIDPTTYIISGDRFVDYPEKAAFRENRVLETRIINRRVVIPRLEINFEYSNEKL